LPIHLVVRADVKKFDPVLTDNDEQANAIGVRDRHRMLTSESTVERVQSEPRSVSVFLKISDDARERT